MSDTQDKLNAELKEARALFARGDLTAAEQKDLDARLDRIEGLRDDITVEQLKAAAGGPNYDGDSADDELPDFKGDFYDALQAGGWSPKHGAHQPGRVMVPAKALGFGQKSDLIATESGANPLRLGPAVEMGRDPRYIFQTIPTKPIAVGQTSIQYLRQTTRTLATVANMQLAIDSSTDKPVTDTVMTLVTEAPIWHANRSNFQPNALFAVPELRQVLNNDLAQAVRESVDDNVVDVMRGAAGIVTLTQGTDTIADAIVKAKGDVLDQGYNASVVAIFKDDLEPLLLAKDGVDRYYSLAGFLRDEFGLTIVPSKTLTTGKVLVFDPAVVDLYISGFTTFVDPYTEAKSNRTQVIAESYANVAVKQAKGICELTLN